MFCQKTHQQDSSTDTISPRALDQTTETEARPTRVKRRCSARVPATTVSIVVDLYSINHTVTLVSADLAEAEACRLVW